MNANPLHDAAAFKSRRIELRLSQMELALRAGVSVPTVARLERGLKVYASTERLMRAALWPTEEASR